MPSSITLPSPSHRQNAHGLEVEVEDVSDSLAALALQGPTSR